MVNVANAAAERIGGPESRAVAIDADACASRYGISKRHWLRLVDRGAAPQPIRLGRLVRWKLESLASWDTSGNKPIRQVGRAG
jgi:predicted DNA-binding transcriptional regulator AlpA